MRNVIQIVWSFGLLVVQTIATPIGENQNVHDQTVLVDGTYIDSPVTDFPQGINEDFGNDNVHATIEVNRPDRLNPLSANADIFINIPMLEDSKIGTY